MSIYPAELVIAAFGAACGVFVWFDPLSSVLPVHWLWVNDILWTIAATLAVLITLLFIAALVLTVWRRLFP